MVKANLGQITVYRRLLQVKKGKSDLTLLKSFLKSK